MRCEEVLRSSRWYSSCVLSRDTQELLDLAEITNRFHLATIQTQDEFSWIAITLSSHSFSDGRLKGSGGGVAIRFAATLTNRVMSGPDGCPVNGSFDASLIMSRAEQINNLAFERQFLCYRGTQSRFAHIVVHNECADCADVNHAETRQLFRDQRGLTSISCTDVHRTKKNDPLHKVIVNG